jgi:hypothetical protein
MDMLIAKISTFSRLSAPKPGVVCEKDMSEMLLPQRFSERAVFLSPIFRSMILNRHAFCGHSAKACAQPVDSYWKREFHG